MKTRLIETALFTPLSGDRWGLPLIMWGEPGVAKTAVIRALARLWGWHCEVLSPGERGEGAFGVTPVPEEGGSVLRYPPPEWVEALAGTDGEEGVVFVDEANTAPPALQPALMGLVQERRVGGHQLGPRVRVLAAANPVGHAAGGWDLAAPVANRFGHVTWPCPDVGEWVEWLTSGANGGSDEHRDPRAHEMEVLDAWPEAFASAAGQVGAFLRRRPELLHRMPADGDPNQSRAWASPRAWEYATRALASARIHGLSQADTEELVAAFVGEAVSGELATWLAEADLPSPADVLDGKVEWTPDSKRLDRNDAVLNACTALVHATKAADKKAARAQALWAILLKVGEVGGKDLTIPAATALTRAGLVACPEARKVLASLPAIGIGR